MKKIVSIVLLVFLPALLAGCGNRTDGEAEEKTKAEVRSPAELAADLDKGPRAVAALTLDSAQAELGAALFDDKICSDCHTLGEADMSPDLLGVLERRTLPWLTKQITDPGWMNEHDPLTRALIEEFDMEMAGPEVTAAEAEAILHYLLRESGAAAD